MSLTHCRFLGKSQLLISPLLFLIKGHTDDATEATIATAVPTWLMSVGNRANLQQGSLSTCTLRLKRLSPWGHFLTAHV